MRGFRETRLWEVVDHFTASLCPGCPQAAWRDLRAMMRASTAFPAERRGVRCVHGSGLLGCSGLLCAVGEAPWIRELLPRER